MHQTSATILLQGLLHAGYDANRQERMSNELKERYFCAHYGSSPAVLANVWNDLCDTDIVEATIPQNERNCGGLKMFLVAQFYLWNKPRNAIVLSSRFWIAESRAQGESLWKWINRVAALKAVKIAWDEALDDPDDEIFIVSLDGVDFKTREEVHPRYPVDPQMRSHKMNHAAWKYEIALAIFRERIVFASGPEKASVHDMTMFRNNGLKAKMLQLPGKMIIGDGGYQTAEPDEINMISTPNPVDPEGLRNFKSRVRLRHETINSRMKQYAILKHGFELGKERHASCFYAVLVMIQYKMDHGSYLYRP